MQTASIKSPCFQNRVKRRSKKAKKRKNWAAAMFEPNMPTIIHKDR